MSTNSRLGNLGAIFKEGESDLLNCIARLSVLYEDLRLETTELANMRAKLDETGEVDHKYRVVYFLRRVFTTLSEFGGILNDVPTKVEFNQASLPAMDSAMDSVKRSNGYFQPRMHRINEFRNEFGAHVKPAGVEFAIRHLSDVTGKVTWNSSYKICTFRLECDFATDIIRGAISSKLQHGADVRTKFKSALEMVSQAFEHAEAAIAALVDAFLWDRFGR